MHIIRLKTKAFTCFFFLLLFSEQSAKQKPGKTEKKKPLMTDTILTGNLSKYLVFLQSFKD